MPLLQIQDNSFRLVDVIAAARRMSKSDARRLIKGGGVTVWISEQLEIPYGDPLVPQDPEIKFTCTEDYLYLIKAGKRNYFTVSEAISELLVIPYE